MRWKSITVGIVALVTALVGGVAGPAPAQAATATFPKAESCAEFPTFYRTWDAMPKTCSPTTRWVPQGLAYDPSRKWLLVSYYDGRDGIAASKKYRSMLTVSTLAGTRIKTIYFHAKDGPAVVTPARWRSAAGTCTSAPPRASPGHPDPAVEDRQGEEHRHAAELSDLLDRGCLVRLVPPGAPVRRRLRERPGLPLRHDVQGCSDQEDPGGLSDAHVGPGLASPTSSSCSAARTAGPGTATSPWSTGPPGRSGQLDAQHVAGDHLGTELLDRRDAEPVRALRVRIDGVRGGRR